MPSPLLVIVSGPPCTGKTTLAERLSGALSIPLLSKDCIKETLFDELGVRDREWSRRLGKTSVVLLLRVADRLLAAGCSCIVESNFHPAHVGDTLRRLQCRHSARAVQIQCVTDGDALYRRFQDRARSGTRHRGHGDLAYVAEFAAVLRRGRYPPLDVDGALIWVDTTDFGAVDYAGLARALAAYREDS